ncbi:hypothetical protein [Planctomicrobium piriforme]|uniref:STAS domain-containing protein n=1 Tax=Planctomicrobium piriforme TaxID=1576369 RepID=A0A1I3G3C7_9PLAN|nr:hypothetical protein [Planctomicrobium piriforme]SFI17980.1 hypothetical protein SAMN05421753_106160 [Planctomicrobium piriforme]
MAERKRTQGLEIVRTPGMALVAIDHPAWDGTSLSLLRDTLVTLIDQEQCQSVVVDLSRTVSLPGGVFGTLSTWAERGIEIRLLKPSAEVQRMLWFQKFVVPIEEQELYALTLEERGLSSLADDAPWREPAGC